MVNEDDVIKSLGFAYKELLSVLPDSEFVIGDIAREACAHINSFGPFERSEFETSDICQMLGHLSVYGVIKIRAVNRISKTGRFEGNTLFYSRAANILKNQIDIFEIS